MASQNSSQIRTRAAKIPRQSRGRARVDALVTSAAGVFAEKGFEAATMTEIAARAGASIGSLYQYFPVKDDVAAELHARQLDAFAAMLEELSATCSGEPVVCLADRLFEGLLAFLEENPSFVVVGNRRSIDPDVKRAARDRLRGLIAGLLTRAEPPVPEDRLKPLAAVLLHLIRVATMLRADEDAAIRQSAVDELRAMLKTHLVDAAART